jgi:hypothetical protein
MEVLEHRAQVLEAAFKQHPARLKGKLSRPMKPPKAAWINKPDNEAVQI